MEDCGGNYQMMEFLGKKLKLCQDCTLPHAPKGYDHIMKKITDEKVSN